MEFYEINAVLEYHYYKHKDGWEQARLISYLIAQTNSKKQLTLQDIVKFYWEDNEEHDTSISTENINRLKKMSDNFLKKMNKKKKNGNRPRI